MTRSRSEKFAVFLLQSRPNNHYNYNYDRQKYPTFFAFPRMIHIVYDVSNIKQHKLFGVDASCPLPDVTPKQTKSLAVVEVVHDRFFTLLLQQGQSAGPTLKAQSLRGNAFRENRKNSELFKKPEPGALLHWERISSSNQPNFSPGRYEALLITYSRYNSLRDRERSLDRGSLRRALPHSTRNSTLANNDLQSRT